MKRQDWLPIDAALPLHKLKEAYRAIRELIEDPFKKKAKRK